VDARWHKHACIPDRQCRHRQPCLGERYGVHHYCRCRRVELIIVLLKFPSLGLVVQIPKGSKARGGEEPTMKQDFSFQFKTPTIKVIPTLGTLLRLKWRPLLSLVIDTQISTSYPPLPIGRCDTSHRLPLNPIFLVTFDQFVSPNTFESITIHTDTKTDRAPFGQLRLLNRDSKEFEYVSY